MKQHDVLSLPQKFGILILLKLLLQLKVFCHIYSPFFLLRYKMKIILIIHNCCDSWRKYWKLFRRELGTKMKRKTFQNF